MRRQFLQQYTLPCPEHVADPVEQENARSLQTAADRCDCSHAPRLTEATPGTPDDCHNSAAAAVESMSSEALKAAVRDPEQVPVSVVVVVPGARGV